VHNLTVKCFAFHETLALWRLAASVLAVTRCHIGDFSNHSNKATHIGINTGQPCPVLAAGAILLLPLDHVGCVLVHHGGACYDSIASHVSTSIFAPQFGQYDLLKKYSHPSHA
jgi:hypothetical protein